MTDWLVPVNLFLFPSLLIGCFLLNRNSKQTQLFSSVGTNPVFQKFQRIYFVVYLPAVYADWLQVPYLYKLYSSYGFIESQIAILYVFGLVSSLISGSCAGSLAQRYGRKPLSLIFILVYILSSALKVSSSYGALLVSEILRGGATSVLFAALEAWYVHEHTETHDFPKEWISLTFNKASFWNGILGVGAGLFSYFPGTFFPAGPVWPYGLSIPCLVFSGFMILTKWTDNCGNRTSNFKKSLVQGIRSICSDSRILLIGAIQSAFESIIYIFAFLWTPVLMQAHQSQPPLGMVFANFMLCSFAGGSIYHLTTRGALSARFELRPYHMLSGALAIALIAFGMLVASTNPAMPDRTTTFLAFLVLEVAAGLYFPSMSRLRKATLPTGHQLSIGNLFRAPLYMLACAGLLVLHEDSTKHGNRVIFIFSALLLSSALVSSILLAFILKRTDSLDFDDQPASISSSAPPLLPVSGDSSPSAKDNS